MEKGPVKPLHKILDLLTAVPPKDLGSKTVLFKAVPLLDRAARPYRGDKVAMIRLAFGQFPENPIPDQSRAQPRRRGSDKLLHVLPTPSFLNEASASNDSGHQGSIT
jgi:hypothetical protein